MDIALVRARGRTTRLLVLALIVVTAVGLLPGQLFGRLSFLLFAIVAFMVAWNDLYAVAGLLAFVDTVFYWQLHLPGGPINIRGGDLLLVALVTVWVWRSGAEVGVWFRSSLGRAGVIFIVVATVGAVHGILANHGDPRAAFDQWKLLLGYAALFPYAALYQRSPSRFMRTVIAAAFAGSLVAASFNIFAAVSGVGATLDLGAVFGKLGEIGTANRAVDLVPQAAFLYLVAFAAMFLPSKGHGNIRRQMMYAAAIAVWVLATAVTLSITLWIVMVLVFVGSAIGLVAVGRRTWRWLLWPAGAAAIGLLAFTSIHGDVAGLVAHFASAIPHVTTAHSVTTTAHSVTTSAARTTSVSRHVVGGTGVPRSSTPTTPPPTVVSASVAHRLAEGKALLHLLMNNPVFGSGLGAILHFSVGTVQVFSVTNWHDDYLFFLGELGILGFLAAMWVGWEALRTAWRLLGLSADRVALGVVCGSVIVGAAVGGVSFDLLTSRDSLPLVAMALGLLLGASVEIGSLGSACDRTLVVVHPVDIPTDFNRAIWQRLNTIGHMSKCVLITSSAATLDAEVQALFSVRRSPLVHFARARAVQSACNAVVFGIFALTQIAREHRLGSVLVYTTQGPSAFVGWCSRAIFGTPWVVDVLDLPDHVWHRWCEVYGPFSLRRFVLYLTYFGLLRQHHIYRQADLVFAVAPRAGAGLAKSLVDKYHVPSERVCALRNGVDIQRTRSSLLTSSPVSKESSSFVVFFAGVLYEANGAVDLIEALAGLNIRNKRLVVAGDLHPGFVASFARLCEDLNIADSISVLGWLPHREVLPWIRAADACVYVSPVTEEDNVRYAMPIKVCEYLACGGAVVISDQPGRRSLVRPGQNALVVRAGDVGGLGRALECLAADPNKAAALRAAAWDGAPELDWGPVNAEFASELARCADACGSLRSGGSWPQGMVKSDRAHACDTA